MGEEVEPFREEASILGRSTSSSASSSAPDDPPTASRPIRADAAAVKAERDGLDDEAWDEADLPEMLARRLDRPSAVCFRFGANSTGGGYAVGIDFEP